MTRAVSSDTIGEGALPCPWLKIGVATGSFPVALWRLLSAILTLLRGFAVQKFSISYVPSLRDQTRNSGKKKKNREGVKSEEKEKEMWSTENNWTKQARLFGSRRLTEFQFGAVELYK